MAAMGKLGIGNQDHTVLARGVKGGSWGCGAQQQISSKCYREMSFNDYCQKLNDTH